jgi:antitoxin component of MazEF toxin-antitoxin module
MISKKAVCPQVRRFGATFGLEEGDEVELSLENGRQRRGKRTRANGQFEPH